MYLYIMNKTTKKVLKKFKKKQFKLSKQKKKLDQILKK